MFTTQQYRTKAAEYAGLARTASNPAEVLEFQTLERSFTALADNEQWLANNQGKFLHWETKVGFAGDDTSGPEDEEEDEEEEEEDEEAEEEQVLRCLGAALIMQWDTLPSKLQRELFDKAATMGELLDTGTLKGQVARFRISTGLGRLAGPQP